MPKKRRYKKKRTQIFSWKCLEKRFQIGRRFRILGLSLMVVFCTLMTFCALYLIRFFQQPFAQAGVEVGAPFSWSGGDPVNLVWLVESSEFPNGLKTVVVLHLDPRKERAVFIHVDSEPFSVGSGVVGGLRDISRELALPIQGYFLVDEGSVSRIRGALGSDGGWKVWNLRTVVKILPLLPVLEDHFESNLSLGEIFRVGRFFLTLRDDRKMDVFSDVRADLVSELCVDEVVRDEGAKILILNGTSESGLAGRVAQWVENLGGFILDIENAPQQNYEHSLILTTDLSSYTTRRLSSILGISDLRALQGSLEWARRADIVLILGLDKREFF